MNNKRIAFATLGCKVNTYETQAMEELFSENGYTIVDFSEVADIYVINTCTVTNLGDKKSRKMIRRAKSTNPSACVVATGCYAQAAPDEVSGIEEVNIVVGTKDRKNLINIISQYNNTGPVITDVHDVSEETYFEPLSVKKLKGRARAFLKIQDGCDRYCNYCIIPYVRGRSRSRAPEEILDEVGILARNGFKEIVLTGIHIASYGLDIPDMSLSAILSGISETEGIERIRLSSLEPNIILTEFAEHIKNLPKLCNHFHLSLQSGCDKTLKNMGRRYTASQYRQAVELLRDIMPEVSFTTDVIVGFPGETDEDFSECYKFCENIGFSKIHVFPYSKKKGTAAFSMPEQVPEHIKSERASKLLLLSDRLGRCFLESQIGKEIYVLFEKMVSGDIYEGYTTNYLTVHIKSDESVINSVLLVKISEIIENEILYGVPVENSIT